MTEIDPIPVTADDRRIPGRIRRRLRISHEVAVANANAINARIGDRAAEYAARLDALCKSTDPVWMRLRALYQLIDEHMAHVGNNAGCRRGCSNCCHIAVGVAQPEARMIGEMIGREPQAVPPGWNQFAKFDFGPHNPCTFLVNHECSIHEHRPVACRVHFSLAADGGLCETLPPFSWLVPYMDNTRYQRAYVTIAGQDIADIREYFPRP